MRIASGSATCIGGRETNEDSLLALSDLAVFAVADGVGGHKAGGVASAMATKEVRWRHFAWQARSALPNPPTEESAELLTSLLGLVVGGVHQAVLEAAQRPGHAGMETTLTSLLLLRGYAFVAHVGDSRLYRLRGGELGQVTVDHTLAWDFVRRGIITAEQAAVHPHRFNLAQAIGSSEPISIEVHGFPVQPGDTYLLCTDGLSKYVPDEVICGELLANGECPELAAENLVALSQLYTAARPPRGGQDNTTVVVVHVRP